MSDARVTIAIPTFNQSDYLRFALASALEQRFTDLQILVLDNASTDNTEKVVRGFSDTRIRYIRNDSNIGLFRNWNRAIALNQSEFISILPSDDVLLPEFVGRSVQSLERYPAAGFSFCAATYIDENGLSMVVPINVGRMPVPGLVDGLDYLHLLVAGRNWTIFPPSALIRASAIAECGPFNALHSFHSIDLNLYIRLAARFPMVFIDEQLAQFRVHARQVTEVNFRQSGGTGPLSVAAERTDAVSYLLQSPRATDPAYRDWLAERLLRISQSRSQLTADLVPNMNLTWREHQEAAVDDICTVLGEGNSFLLIDEDCWDPALANKLPATVFSAVSHDGGSSPATGTQVVETIEKSRRAGCRYLVIAWPAFWWLDFYPELEEYFASAANCIFRNSHILIYDLQPPADRCRR